LDRYCCWLTAADDDDGYKILLAALEAIAFQTSPWNVSITVTVVVAVLLFFPYAGRGFGKYKPAFLPTK
jgi:hypothetical protein